MELRDRGYIDASDAIEVCNRCWRRADRALRELQTMGTLKRVSDGKPRRRGRWTFIES